MPQESDITLKNLRFKIKLYVHFKNEHIVACCCYWQANGARGGAQSNLRCNRGLVRLWNKCICPPWTVFGKPSDLLVGEAVLHQLCLERIWSPADLYLKHSSVVTNALVFQSIVLTDVPCLMETEPGEFKEDSPFQMSTPLLWAIHPLSNHWLALLAVSQTHFWWALDSHQSCPLLSVLFITFVEWEQPGSGRFPVRLALDCILHDCMLFGDDAVLLAS